MIETRDEHMAWAKNRALAYVDAGDLNNAFVSIASDLQKHPDTANHAGIQIGLMQIAAGLLDTPEKMRKFIEGFR